ncbi:MAG TPA: glycosyltransferase, partial [Pyrinomonadaceae bacterium]|nr:glycosyltransferase [Pyrinomonadaceae bacterium]
ILRRAIESVRGQIYENWELCIADDRSTLGHVREILEEFAAADTRIKVVFRNENGHISAASNSALELATGRFIALLDHDDELAPHAFYFVAKEINAHPDSDIIYSDEDKTDERGRRFAPFFKPDWSPDLLYSVNYVNHLTVYRTELLRECGGFRVGFEGSQDYDVLLRMVERTKPENIRHIPKVLYHWRAVAGSVAQAADEKPYAHGRARAAIAEHFERTGVSANVVRGVGQLHRVVYELPKPEPMVSIVAAAGDHDRLYDAIASTTRLPFELISAGAARPSNSRIKFIDSDESALFISLNRGAHAAVGAVICFLTGDAIEFSEDWLSTLVGHALQEGVGAAGPMIIDRDGKIHNAGFTIGLAGAAASVFEGEPVSPRGRSLRLDVVQNVSAISVGCMVIRKELFHDVGGFDGENFGTAYGDVDLCLRLIESGLRNVWTPWATVIEQGRSAENDRSELVRLRSKWPTYFAADPYYNPNLSLDSADMSLAQPPRMTRF